MLFSDLYSILYSIKKTSKDSWFDPILDHDTKLFIDPFLVFRKGGGHFKGAHDTILEFFRFAFRIAARTGGKTSGVQHSKLLSMLLFPEVDELRLGHAKEGNSGAGTAKGFAKEFAAAIMESIALGLISFRHFEEIGIFNKNIGRDRISDITANILKPHLVAYTQEVCARHKIPLKPFRSRLGFDLESALWEDDTVDLPANPMTQEAVLLVPKHFLRTDPSLEKEGFRDFLWEKHNKELRDDLNYTLKSDIGAEDIIALAREHRDWLAEYVISMEKEGNPLPYDLETDPEGLYKWHKITSDFVARNPHTVAVTSDRAFSGFLEVLAERFKLFVEKKGGWKLVWDKKSPLSEQGIQLYFYGIAYHYCQANDIVMLREVETGRGPVDFHFSTGYKRRALMEAKLAKNGHFWNNLPNQLPEYMLAEEILLGHYLIVCYTDHDVRMKVSRISSTLREASSKTGYPITHTVVDARPDKPPASKLK